MDYVCNEVIGKHVSNRDHVRGCICAGRVVLYSPVLGPMAAHAVVPTRRGPYLHTSITSLIFMIIHF